VAKTETAWRCSQCGTVNEAGARTCSGCGKWPSLFDLKNTVDAAPAVADDLQEPELFDPELFDPETFETFEPQPFEAETVQPEPVEPEEDEEESDGKRLRRWAISAIWIIGIIVWFVANTFGNR